MTTLVDLRGVVRSPYDLMEITWEVDGASGTTHCEAWRGQYEIDCLEQAGYRITGVRRIK